MVTLSMWQFSKIQKPLLILYFTEIFDGKSVFLKQHRKHRTVIFKQLPIQVGKFELCTEELRGALQNIGVQILKKIGAQCAQNTGI